MLTAKYDRIKIDGELIYATSRGLTSVYDKNSTKITPSGWHALGNFGEDNLLLVQKCKTQKDTNSSHTWKKCVSKFITKKGALAFNLDQYDYTDVGLFSNGYAAIKNKNGLWGYVNTKGTLIIPFKYTEARRFHKKYALVTAKNDDEILIDSQDKVFKKFKDTIQQHQGGYAEYDIYLLKDGSRYSGDGELLEK